MCVLVSLCFDHYNDAFVIYYVMEKKVQLNFEKVLKKTCTLKHVVVTNIMINGIAICNFRMDIYIISRLSTTRDDDSRLLNLYLTLNDVLHKVKTKQI